MNEAALPASRTTSKVGSVVVSINRAMAVSTSLVSGARRQMEQAHIIAISPFHATFYKAIVRQTEGCCWEQIGALAIGHERTGFAHQRPNHMSIINPMLLKTSQTRKREDNSAPDISLTSVSALIRTRREVPIKREGTE